MLKDMADTLDREADGVALAAPQIGLPYRMFIVRYDRTVAPEVVDASDEGSKTQPKSVKETEPSIGVFINPHFVKSSRRRTEMWEGCLSVRGFYGYALRNERATVRAQDEHGTWFERGGGGLIAEIYQHEIDHLEGILFIDHAEGVVAVKDDGTKEDIREAQETAA